MKKKKKDMELKAFVEETLMQIVEGIQSAQEKGKEKGAVISPSYVHGNGGDNMPTTEYNKETRIVSNVEFEVGLTASDSKEGKIGVWFGEIGIGGQRKTGTKNVSVTSVRFSVPVAFPAITTGGMPTVS
ncbi:MAG: hypothetical protein LBG17_05075 [Bacteroidales bacterium]|jgi:hypothetical protein|nr:hypothetical protein [Bacteroidales bacterium]